MSCTTKTITATEFYGEPKVVGNFYATTFTDFNGRGDTIKGILFYRYGLYSTRFTPLNGDDWTFFIRRMRMLFYSTNTQGWEL